MPCTKRKLQSPELQVKKKKMDRSLLVSDKSGQTSQMTQRSQRTGVPQRKALVQSKKVSLVQLKEEREKQPRRSSRLKTAPKKQILRKKHKLSNLSAELKELGSKSVTKVSGIIGDKLVQSVPVLKKGSKKYSRRVKRGKCQSPPPETASTVSAALYPVLIEHNYGRLPDLHSKDTTMPDKNRVAGITDLSDQNPTMYSSAMQESQATEDKISIISSDEKRELSADPTKKFTVTLDAKVSVMRKSPPPLQALFKVIQETNFNGKNISGIDKVGVVNTCSVQQTVQSAGVSCSSECSLISETYLKLDDFEIEHCVVEIETVEEVVGDLGLSNNDHQPIQDWHESAALKETSKAVVCKESTSTSSLPQDTAKDSTQGSPAQAIAEPPKKQAMNPQARTKARLAALAEEKAAAAKRPPPKQLNLLALCEEIADDIASDTAAAAAAAAAKRIKEECDQFDENSPGKSEVEDVSVPSVSRDLSLPEPPSENTSENKVHKNTTKKRFFLSQVSIPLKTQEKKKLSRFQRLRQVELQRDKLTWTCVKKLKSDQASQDISKESTEPLPVSGSISDIDSPLQLPPDSVSKVAPSERRRVLPAVAPPMPNGIADSKLKPAVEYKPFNPRTKYSPDDFELDETEEASKPPALKQEVNTSVTLLMSYVELLHCLKQISRFL